jgi:hypothetical protein
MTADRVLYLSKADVETVGLEMQTIIDLLERPSVLGSKPGRQSAAERTMAINLGLGNGRHGRCAGDFPAGEGHGPGAIAAAVSREFMRIQIG